MTPADFRRIALGLEGAEEGSHMGAVDFRVGGRIFATLAAIAKGYGNLMLTPGQQAIFVAEEPEVFVPLPGGWGRNGVTHILLSKTNEDQLTGALRTAWKVRVDQNRKTVRKPASARRKSESSRSSATKSSTKKSSAKKSGSRARRSAPGK